MDVLAISNFESFLDGAFDLCIPSGVKTQNVKLFCLNKFINGDTNQHVCFPFQRHQPNDCQKPQLFPTSLPRPASSDRLFTAVTTPIPSYDRVDSVKREEILQSFGRISPLQRHLVTFSPLRCQFSLRATVKEIGCFVCHILSGCFSLGD